MYNMPPRRRTHDVNFNLDLPFPPVPGCCILDGVRVPAAFYAALDQPCIKLHRRNSSVTRISITNLN